MLGMADVPSSSRIYHNNVAKDQSRVHYGDVHGDAYYGDVLNNKRDIARACAQEGRMVLALFC